jgi:hypothetical protein
MQKPSMVGIVWDTNEAVEEVIDLFDKQCFSEVSLVYVTGKNNTGIDL